MNTKISDWLGSYSYEDLPDSYLKKRQLKGKANALLLWGLGVGAVISGDFFGWNFGLGVGGFWGMAIATILMSIMYISMVCSIAELSCVLPFAGGFYGFTRIAFGPFLGFVCGISVIIEYIITPAVIVYGTGSYLQGIFPQTPTYILWLATYIIFIGINLLDVIINLYVALFLTIAAILVLFIFYVSMLAGKVFSPDLLFNIPADPGQIATFLPKGWGGILAAISYAIWFFLAIEEVPMAAEETNKVAKNMPWALISGIITLIGLGFLTLILNTGVGRGAIAIAKSGAPLADGFSSFFGQGVTSNIVTAISLIFGMVASFHTIVYAYGRGIFSLSRSGYIPRSLSITNKNGAPVRALILGGIIGFLCTVIIDQSRGGTKNITGAVLLYMSVFGAVISYTLVMLSYIKIKITMPSLARPYKSPLGIIGAIIGSVLAVVSLLACFSTPDYRPGVIGVGIFMAGAIAYFLIYSRHQLVLQEPEEQIALLLENKLN
ncbi:MAG TPA: amino acid permease [Allocoleopsis sp.]